MDTELYIGSIVNVSLEIKEITENKKGINYVLCVPGKPSTFNQITVESEAVNEAQIPTEAR